MRSPPQRMQAYQSARTGAHYSGDTFRCLPTTCEFRHAAPSASGGPTAWSGRCSATADLGPPARRHRPQHQRRDGGARKNRRKLRHAEQLAALKRRPRCRERPGRLDAETSAVPPAQRRHSGAPGTPASRQGLPGFRSRWRPALRISGLLRFGRCPI
jgi:hypothetical protein